MADPLDPWLDLNGATVYAGDCIEVMAALPAESVDAVVTDPPYALPGGFMGKSWDRIDGRADIGACYHLAGLIDGEGCFRVQRHERGSHSCTFSMQMRADDGSILRRAAALVGAGTVSKSAHNGGHPMVRWAVQDQEGCQDLVGFLRRFPLRAKKSVDFEAWAEAVGEWVDRPRGNRWSGPADQARAAALKARIEAAREFRDVPWSGHRFQDWCREWSEEALRVLKPGGHALVFGGTRTFHRMTCGLEDAGFEIRDVLSWLYGSGFPKSRNLDGAWQGWGTALKPGWEPAVLARKPLAGTVAANVLEHGTGALNVDGCRIESSEPWAVQAASDFGGGGWGDAPRESHPAGRWPANVVLDSRAAGMLDAEIGESTSGAPRDDRGRGGIWSPSEDGIPAGPQYGDTGGPSRFFYTAKASRKERVGSRHPTVKPVSLMRWLVRMVTPPGGVVLDPFAGSGTTGEAAINEGFRVILVEREEEYLEGIRTRVVTARRPG